MQFTGHLRRAGAGVPSLFERPRRENVVTGTGVKPIHGRVPDGMARRARRPPGAGKAPTAQIGSASVCRPGQTGLAGPACRPGQRALSADRVNGPGQQAGQAGTVSGQGQRAGPLPSNRVLSRPGQRHLES